MEKERHEAVQAKQELPTYESFMLATVEMHNLANC